MVASVFAIARLPRRAVRLAAARRSIAVGVQREDSVWESRAPLSPRHVAELARRLGLVFIVQPSRTRVFADEHYRQAGAAISDSLHQCDLILGVKEIPPAQILPDKTYFCFSHTHKGQRANMPMLHALMDARCSLVDYELLVDARGRRLVAFGRFAGYAGMINCLHGLGLQFLARGHRTPFVNVAPAHNYPSLRAARAAIREVGRAIERDGLPKDLLPLTVLFTGHGAVSKGAQELFSELPVQFVPPTQIAQLQGCSGRRVYGSVVGAAEYCRRRDGAPFAAEQYLASPEDFESVFAAQLAPFATAIVNGIYWEARYPRLISMRETDALLASPASRLLAIADITCDLHGSIEATSRASSISDPFLYHRAHGRALQIMSISNLPAQLPADATEFFGDQLVPVIEQFVEDRLDGAAVRTATILRRGQLEAGHAALRPLAEQAKRRRVLILGSGHVAGPVVKHLGSLRDVEVTIGSDVLEEAERLAKASPHGACVEKIDIGDGERLGVLVEAADLVISLVPATMHLPIARLCLEHKKHLVTASYISPAMQQLHEPAAQAGLLFLNEIGLDPGLDHLSAKKIIDAAQRDGERVVSFTSWCGGLPAPECADNPFGYKFSWSPRGVLLAALNGARFREAGQEVVIPGDRLLSSARRDPFESRLCLEGLPNRDSLKYETLYGIGGAATMLRGTLRYRGFSELMRGYRAMGMLDQGPVPPEVARCSSWAQVAAVLRCDRRGREDEWARLDVSRDKMLESMEWLGFLSEGEPFARGASVLDSFSALLEKKLRYEEGERDMVVMQHDLVVERAGSRGERRRVRSTLIEYGEAGGWSAMAKTVGYPVAVAAELILEGAVRVRGVRAPVERAVYEPLLARLESTAGIRFKETSSICTCSTWAPAGI